MVDISIEETIQVLRRYIRLQERGVPLIRTFETLELHGHGRLKTILHQMRGQLETGTSLTSVFSELIRDRQLIELLATSERTHRFLDGMRQVVLILQLNARTKREFHQLVRYPLVICCGLLLLGTIYALYVFPKLMAMVSTEHLNGWQAVLLSRWFFPSLGLGIVVIGVLLFLRAKQRQRFVLSVFEQGMRLYTTYLFVSDLSILSNEGTSLLHLLQRMKDGEGEMSQMANRIHERLGEGMSLEDAVRRERRIEYEVISLIAVSSASGQLGPMMTIHRELVFEELEQYTKRLLTKVEPVIYGGLSILVISLFYTIYLPIQLMMHQL